MTAGTTLATLLALIHGSSVHIGGGFHHAHHDFGHFYGSSYVGAPNGARTPGLSRTRDGLLVSEINLNHCRQVKDLWGFQMTMRLEEYAKALANAAKPGFQPQIIRDTGK